MNEQFSQNTSSNPRVLIPLENIRVAAPCRADWDLMDGDDRVRFCNSCEKHVYNLSALSKADAEKLITDKQGKLCVQYYQRADGTILTDDCPVGIKVVVRPFKFLLTGFAVLLASGASLMAKDSSTPATRAVASHLLQASAKIGAMVSTRNTTHVQPAIAMTGIPAPRIVRGDMALIKGEPAPAPTPTPTPKPENSDPVILGQIICVPEPTPTPVPEPEQ